MKSSKRVLLSLSLSALMALGCSDDNNNGGGTGGSAGTGGSGGTGGSMLLGTFELQEVTVGVDRESRPPIREDAAYLRFDEGNEFFVLRATKDNGFRIVDDGVFAIVGSGQVFLNSSLYNYDLSGDTLMLSRPDSTIQGTASNSAPAPEEWVKPMTTLETFSIPQIQQARDMTWDGTHLWVGNRGDQALLYKVDMTTGAVVDTLAITQTVYALAWDGTDFWVSSNGSVNIFKVDPTTGNSTMTSAEMGAWPYGIAWDGRDLWVYSNNERTLYQYDPAGNVVVDSVLLEDSPGSGGMEYLDGRLYMALGGTIHVVETNPFVVVDAYELKGTYLEGITHDGTNFYVISQNDDEGVDIRRVSLSAAGN